MIGIDDWAKRRGQSYGTVFVDLLKDREAETLASWLRAQPQIQVVARDRSMQYAQGVTKALHKLFQVADRWHLLKNVSEMVQRVLHEVVPRLRQQMSP